MPAVAWAVAYTAVHVNRNPPIQPLHSSAAKVPVASLLPLLKQSSSGLLVPLRRAKRQTRRAAALHLEMLGCMGASELARRPTSLIRHRLAKRRHCNCRVGSNQVPLPNACREPRPHSVSSTARLPPPPSLGSSLPLAPAPCKPMSRYGTAHSCCGRWRALWAKSACCLVCS